MWLSAPALRPYYLALLIFLVFFGAWWWPVALGLVGILLYPKFYEVLLPALLLDLIYGASNLGWFGWQFAASAMALILVLVINQLKRYLNL